ncbi:polysaccharide deacetylase family protein [Gorillibacterium sp. sgz500922]|uniref:polysaccharide deacetylase family protein n=1 Tax=Gorillibacterium sp. sgz500922 TaxID=3446694 RepID=UPI003F67982C
MKKRTRRWLAAAVLLVLAAGIGWLAYGNSPVRAGANPPVPSAGSPTASANSPSASASPAPTAGSPSASPIGGQAPSASPAAPAGSPVPAEGASGASPAPGSDTVKRVPYHGSVEHLFFHPLVVYPELAFDGDSMAKGYFDWFVTVKEFRSILDDLYKNQYLLIRPDDLYGTRTGANGKTELYAKDLLLPEGKKPLILSVDDNNYYDYMRQNGNIQKLVIGDDGRVAGFAVDPKGSRVTARDNDIVPLLDDFVAAHPEFSYNGAKGVLALTGYEGVLGYRTNDASAAGYAEEKAGAERVIKELKATGWSFASHGWGHRDAAKITPAHLAQDTDRWLKEVEPLIGPTNVYIYPYGSSVDRVPAKLKLLQDRGFQVFCSVGPLPYLKITKEALFMDRRHIDGMALTQTPKRLAPLFDAAKALDPARPKAAN